MPIRIPSSGPLTASIMVVGESPGEDDETERRPFAGTAGGELTKMLNEAGILRTECYLTNVCKYRPPENKIDNFFLDGDKRTKPNEFIKEGVLELVSEIQLVKPKIIIALGNVAIWSLAPHNYRAATGLITKWRGSMLTHKWMQPNGEGWDAMQCMMIPTYTPTFILRNWENRSIAVHDLKRATRALETGGWPDDKIKVIVRPSFQTVLEQINFLLQKANASVDPLLLASDLETRSRYIACHGIAWSEHEAISIPIQCVERPLGYWSVEQETAIWERERELLTHPNVEVVGQNYLYDAQYFARRRGYVPRLRHDTLFGQHVAYAGLPKALDFLSSMYCRHHVYWKDDGKEWDSSIPEEQYWGYNGKDACKTFEVHRVLQGILASMNLMPQYQFQMRLWHIVLRMMLRGIRVDQKLRDLLGSKLIEAAMSRQGDLEYILQQQFNINSTPQMRSLFYDQLKCKPIFNRKTKKLTLDEDALTLIAQREPLLRCITERIIDLRSIGVMLSNVIRAELDTDGRIRSSFSPTAETYRWKSSKNAFGGGTNLQNWTKGDEDKESAAIIGYPIPNVRRLIVPDFDCEIASIDLSGADAQAIAWEAGDEKLKAMFRAGVKLHAENAKMIFPDQCKTGYEQPYYDQTRTGVHLVNFCGQDKTLAAALGSSIEVARRFRNKWFKLHPEIPAFHEKIEDQLMRTRTVWNRFGYKRFFFERVSEILPEAIAWMCQSNTACVANHALVAAEEQVEMMNDLHIEFLLQVHDELVFQYPSSYRNQVLRALKPIVHIPVPFEDPLTIPWGLKVSTKSWGDCEKIDWPS